MNILLIAGGWSSERNVSLAGAQGIERALKERGHTITFFDLKTHFNDLLATAKKHDFAFIALHGSPGEDGLVQAMLDNIGCPYQGSDPTGSFLALNKAATKQQLRAAGLPTADWEFLPEPPEASWKPSFGWPVFIKSNTGGSSLHLGRASNNDEMHHILNNIFAAGECALIEPELQGKEVTCGVLGNEALPPVLIEPLVGDYFDYESKYNQGGARELCPAPLPKAVTTELQRLALAVHTTLNLSGYSRTDFILQEDQQPVILEVNTLPGMTVTSLVPQEAAAIGLSFADLLERLIHLGLERSKKQQA